MATIKEIVEYSKANPESEYAKQAFEHITSGGFDEQARKEGYDLSWAGRPAPEPTFGGKIVRGVASDLARIGNTVSAPIRAGIDKLAGFESQGDIIDPYAGNVTGYGMKEGQTTGQRVKDVIGGVATVASNVVGGGAAANIAKAGIKGAVKQGAIQGAKAGALSGFGSAMEQNKGVLGTVADTAVGGATGGVIGGVAGAVAPISKAISNKLSGVKTPKPVSQEFVTDLVSPKLTQQVKEQAIKEGRATEAGLITKAKVTASNRDNQVAEAVKDVVSDKKTTLQNLDAIKTRISDINNNVKKYVGENKFPFSGNQLKKQLNQGRDELNIIFASDKQAEKTYDAVVNEFMKHVENKDTLGLFEARQSFDKIPAIKKLLDSQGLGENVKKEIALTVRGQANKYIASLLPEGKLYRDQLLQESRMIEAIGNIAEKYASNIGKSKLQNIVNEYPILKLVAGGLIGAAGVGAGGAILGSLD